MEPLVIGIIVLSALCICALFYFLSQTKLQLSTKSALLQERSESLEYIIHERNIERSLREAAEKESVRLAQELTSLKQEREQFERTKEEFLALTKSSIMNAGSELSSKLLDDHKRESLESKQETEKKITETTEKLYVKLQHAFETIKSLSDQVVDTKKTTDLVRDSLLSPVRAGNFAEVTLSNLFKNSGLVSGRDYTLQYTFTSAEGHSLKPDALLYLPNNLTLVIDCKASRFLFEQQENSEGKLAASISQQLKGLKKKDYKEALLELNKNKGEQEIYMVMFLPTDGAVDRIRAAYPDFLEQAWKEEIYPVGPSGMMCLVRSAEMLTAKLRQQEHLDEIMFEVRELISSVSRLYTHADSVGKNLKTALKKYDEFAASFNRHFISKAKKVQQLGVQSSKSKAVLLPLERFQVITQDIEGTVETQENTINIEKSLLEPAN